MPSFAGPFAAELIENAKKIAAPGKGILAADESTGTIGQVRFNITYVYIYIYLNSL